MEVVTYECVVCCCTPNVGLPGKPIRGDHAQAQNQSIHKRNTNAVARGEMNRDINTNSNTNKALWVVLCTVCRGGYTVLPVLCFYCSGLGS